MAKGKSYTKTQVESAKKYLLGLPAPEKTNFSALDVIEEIDGVIKEKLEQGHSMEEIVNGLNASGIEIKLSRFRAVWSKLHPTRRKRTKKEKNVQGDKTKKVSVAETGDND